MTETFPLVDIRQMHLNYRFFKGAQGIVKCNGGVGVGARIDYYPSEPTTNLLYPRDKLSLMIALPAGDIQAKFLAFFDT